MLVTTWEFTVAFVLLSDKSNLDLRCTAKEISWLINGGTPMSMPERV